jgi:hypothetical protein
MAYIDVRSAWPTYFRGMFAVTLVGCNRNITVAEAEDLIIHGRV